MANKVSQKRDPPQSALQALLDPKKWSHEIVEQLRKRTVQAMIAAVIGVAIMLFYAASNLVTLDCTPPLSREELDRCRNEGK